MLNLKFDSASLCLAENDKYLGPMSEKGQQLHERVQKSDPRTLHRSSSLSFTVFQKLWRKLRLWEVISPKSKFRLFSGHGAPQGSWSRRRSRKVADDETPVGINFSSLEYAKAGKILETPQLDLLYYVDVPGIVPLRSETPTTTTGPADPLDIGNGDLPPEWGIDLAILGGTIRYGPWADRQR